MPDNTRIGTRIFFLPHLFFFSIFCFSFSASAQLGTTSPFSRYGIGELKEGYAQNFSMAGLSTAMQTDTLTPFNINVGNPASLPYLRLSTFEAGVSSNTSRLLTSKEEQVTNATSFGYVGLAFPVKKWWGSGFSLQPMSSVGYNVTDTKYLDNVGNVGYVYNGSGSIDKLCWSNGFKFADSSGVKSNGKRKAGALKGLSFGGNVSYLFGRIDNTRKIIFPSSSGYFNYKTVGSTNISDVYFDYGIQYGFTIDSARAGVDPATQKRLKRDLRDKVRIIFGATYSAMTDIDTKTNRLSETFVSNVYGYDIPRDTIENVNQNSSIRLPGKFSVGVTIKKGDKLVVGAEYAIQNWADFKFAGVDGGLKNSSRFTLGVQYVPSHRTDKTDIGYLKKVYYRAGLRYSNLPVNITNSQLKEVAFSFGFGLPVGYTRHNMVNYNSINLGFEIGQRSNAGDLKEQFYNLVVGITLNDRWFIKSKYD